MDQRKVHIGRILSLAVMLFLAGPSLLASQEAPDCPMEGKAISMQVEELIDQAAELDSVAPEQANDRYQEAITKLKLALKQDPEDATAHWLAGRAYIGLEQYAMADSMLTRFTELLPDEGCKQLDRQVRRAAWTETYNSGIRAYQAGDDSTALDKFESANVIWEDARSLNNAALLNQQRGNIERAQELYRQSLEVAEEQEQRQAAAVNLAELLRSQGETEKSLATYEQYLSAHPEDVTATLNYAVGLRKAGMADSAEVIFEELLDRDDLSFQHWFNVGIGLMESESFQSAIRAFEEARTEHTYDKPTLVNLAQAYLAAGNAARSASLGDTLVNWYPYQKSLYRPVMQALNRQGQTDRVQQLLEKLQNLPLEFPQLDMIQQEEGVYVLRGRVIGGTMAGREVTILFEFLDSQGNLVVTEEATLTVPDPNQSQGFQLRVQTDEPVSSFRYGEVRSGS